MISHKNTKSPEMDPGGPVLFQEGGGGGGEGGGGGRGGGRGGGHV
jgi:hypothetical protein